MMRWLVRLIAGSLLALGLATGAWAARPDGKTPSAAIPLPTGSPATGQLAGSTAGAFVYYSISYPGDGSQGTLTLSITPNDPATENAVGINLYQAGSLLTSMNALGSTPGINQLTFSSTVAGPILVQLYNYTAGETVGYTLTLAGVTQSTPAAAPSPSPTPVSTTTTGEATGGVTRLATAASGTLPGNPAGSFVYYTVDYPGDGSTQSVTLTYTPGGPDVGAGLVVNVYQNGALLTATDGTHAIAPGRLIVTYSSTTPGPVLIQIGNYNPAPTISYQISR